MVRRALRARVRHRAAVQARAQLDALKEQAEAIPVHVVHTNDLTRKQVLIYSLVGSLAAQAAVQLLVAWLR